MTNLDAKYVVIDQQTADKYGRPVRGSTLGQGDLDPHPLLAICAQTLGAQPWHIPKHPDTTSPQGDVHAN